MTYPSLMRRALGIALALAMAACSPAPGASEIPVAQASPTPSPNPPPSPSPSTNPGPPPDGKIAAFDKARAMSHARALARDIGVRVQASRGERRAARYVVRRLSAYGYETMVQIFDLPEGRSRNVVAWWPGTWRTARTGIVIGAHMDTAPEAPGANDNASGVAVLLELARLAAGKRQVRWLRFVAFGAEERGPDGEHHLGSETYVARLGDRARGKLAGMVSVDMIADGRPLLVGTSRIGPDTIAKRLYKTFDDAGIDADYRTFCDCSDNGPFELAGVPAALVWSGPEPNYHSPSDTLANLKPADLRRTGRALRAFLIKVGKPMIQALRRAR